MNRVKSFEKHMDPNISHDIYYSSPLSINDSSSYYSHHRYKKGDSNSISSSSEHKISLLTLENLSKIELAEPSSMPLARYCNEIKSASHISAYPESNISSQRKSPQRRIQQQDKVIESPRLLPFPYHNDSYFLPTAEHDYPGGCSITDTSSSMASVSIHTVGFRHHLASSPSLTFPNRAHHRQLITSPRRQHETYSNAHNYGDDMTSTISQKRRAISVTPSSPSTLREDVMVPQKKRRSNNKFATRFKKNLLRFKSNNSTILESTSCSSSYYSPSTSVVWTTTLNDDQSAQQLLSRKESSIKTTNTNNTSWFEKLWKFLRPSSSSTSFVKKNHQKATTSSSSATDEPVWYSQFRCNPSPPSGITLLS